MIDLYHLDKVLQATAKRVNLHVKWEKPGSQPRTDGDTIYLPCPDPLSSQDSAVDALHYYAAHEVSHVLYSDFLPMKEGRHVGAGESLLGLIHNVIEDDRVDSLNGTCYLGDAAASERYLCQLIPKFVADLATTEDSEQRRQYTALLSWSTKVKTTKLAQELAVMLSHLDDKLYSVLDKHTDDMLACRTIEDKVLGTEATWQVACSIFTELGHSVEEELKKARKGKTKVADFVTGDDDSPVTIHWSKLVKTGLHEGGGHVHVDWSGYKSAESWEPTPPNQFIVIDYDKDTGFEAGTWLKRTGLDMLDLPEGRASDAFAQAMRQRLQSYSRVRYEYGLKRGTLNSRAVHRLAIDSNEAVFKRKTSALTLDVAVQVLIDASGSMSGNKYRHAAKAGMLISAAVGNVLHVPTEIVTFTDMVRRSQTVPAHAIIRAFGCHYLSDKVALERFTDAGCHLIDNADGDSILWGYHRVLLRPEKRKVIIVLSDGNPCTIRPGDNYGFTKRVIQAIEAAGVVDLYAIGIMDTNVRVFYKNHCVISTVAELESQLISTIDRALMRGYRT